MRADYETAKALLNQQVLFKHKLYMQEYAKGIIVAEFCYDSVLYFILHNVPHCAGSTPSLTKMRQYPEYTSGWCIGREELSGYYRFSDKNFIDIIPMSNRTLGEL